MSIATNSSLRNCRTFLIALAVALPALPLLAKQAQPPNPQPHMPQRQKHESRHEIDRLEEVWRSALLDGNAPAMEALLADDFMAITPSGTLQTKEQTLANLRSGSPHITALLFSDRKVRFYGTTALVTSLADLTGSNADGDITGSYRYTRVYARDPHGKWKIVSFEASRVRDPGEHK